MGRQRMVTAELNSPIRETARLVPAASVVIGLTTLGIGLALVDPRLAGSNQPHAVLTGSVGDVVGILQTNARTLAVPFLLVLFAFPQSRLGRHAGDLIVTALTAASTIPVGLELGRWQGRLLPYVPQLPVEWVALILAIHAWLIARSGQLDVRDLVPLAAVVLALLICAACLETWATPHQHDQRLNAARDTATWRTGACPSPGFCTGSGPVTSRSQASFPSLRSVPLGHLAGAAGISSSNRPPQGGIK